MIWLQVWLIYALLVVRINAIALFNCHEMKLTGCDIALYLYMYTVYKHDAIDNMLLSHSHVKASTCFAVVIGVIEHGVNFTWFI